MFKIKTDAKVQVKDYEDIARGFFFPFSNIFDIQYDMGFRCTV